ncbi:MAG: hypothetical protein PF513_03950 [Tenericutes bacterium]|jgi:hypothetical protein|nr:hypothetical protein [Mycoplasmatota bacterium]
MKKIFYLLVFLILGITLVSCGNKIEIPEVESSGYDITSITDPLNDRLDKIIITYDEDSVKDDLNIYLQSYDLMDNTYELINLNHDFTKGLKNSKDEFVSALNFTLVVSFEDLEMNESTYDQAEMLFLQMRQDLEANTEYPIFLMIRFDFNNSNITAFSAITGVDKDTDGLSKTVTIRKDGSSNEDDNSLLNYVLTEGFAEYYQKRINVIMRFSNGSFYIKLEPNKEEYSIYREEDMSAKDFMSDYIDGYEEVDWEF